MTSRVRHAGHPEATRIAVDLPQDYCGAASLALRFPDSIRAADNGAGNPQPLKLAMASLGPHNHDRSCDG